MRAAPPSTTSTSPPRLAEVKVFLSCVGILLFWDIPLLETPTPHLRQTLTSGVFSLSVRITTMTMHSSIRQIV